MKATASAKSRADRKHVSEPRIPSPHRADIIGICLVSVGVIMAIGLATSQAGILGSAIARFFTTLFGVVAWAVPPALVILGIGFFRTENWRIGRWTGGLLMVLLALLGGISRPVRGDFFHPDAIATSGGMVGAVLGWLGNSLLGAASLVLWIAVGGIGLLLLFNSRVREVARSAQQTVATVKEKFPARTRAQREPTPEDRKRIAHLRHPAHDAVAVEATAGARAAKPSPPPVPSVEPETPPTKRPPSRPQPNIRDFAKSLPKESEDVKLPTDVPVPHEGYELPPLTVLHEPKPAPPRDAQEMQRNIETLENTLDQFGIEASVVEVATGPTITRYEIQLGPGVRVNRITALADNMAMDLAASQVRVEAPIPGKAAIGIEVPNKKATPVSLRELCALPAFTTADSRLTIALGKDVSGEAVFADIATLPHLLIGGATNSGKSIGLATLITSLLMRNTPKEVRMVMIDPKRVELTLFDRIPHLMCPVIKDVKEAAGVLRAVWREMDRRYDLFSERGFRNIQAFNEQASFADRMPYIVVIIDELADLMIQCGAEVETVIVRLAQLARAVGIHLVIATQRPSVDVITGLIKANIPSRMAFSVASQIDSRTILDSKGAEALIGRGDMLWSPINLNKPMRVQGCYVSEAEIAAICDHWRRQQSPEYVLTPIEATETDGKSGGGRAGEEAPDDDLWADAVRWVAERGEASTSMLQRKFRVGFQRASRLLDMMEERGIVGPRDGSRPRDVLIDPLSVESVLNGRSMTYDIGGTLDDDDERLQQQSLPIDATAEGDEEWSSDEVRVAEKSRDDDDDFLNPDHMYRA